MGQALRPAPELVTLSPVVDDLAQIRLDIDEGDERMALFAVPHRALGSLGVFVHGV